MQVLSEKSDFMRIRRFIVNTMMAHAPNSVKFPPLQKLADKFGVSKPTVLRVVRSLIEQGQLEPCKGGGTISIPASNAPVNEAKTFGVITSSGMLCFEDLYFNSLNAAIKNEIAARDFAFHTTQVSYGVIDCLEKAVAERSLDYLILVSPDEIMGKNLPAVRKTGIPALSFMQKLDGVNSVYRPFGKICRKSLEALFAEGRRKILFFVWESAYYAPETEREISEACAQAGVSRSCVSVYHAGGFRSTAESIAAVKTRLDAGERFDGAVLFPFDKGVYLLLKNRLDLERECRVVLDGFAITRELDFKGYAISQNLPRAACAAIDLLMRAQAGIEHLEIDVEILKDASSINARPA